MLGWPDAWRPYEIFGHNTNNLLNQRLLGEIHLNDFEVTHTKDGIQWYGDDEQELEKGIKEQIALLLTVASTPWKDQDDDERGPSPGDIDLAIAGLRDELLSPEMADKIKVTALPKEEDITDVLRRISHPVKSKRSPDIYVVLGNLQVWVYVVAGPDMSPNDPYVVCEASEGDRVIVIINMQHPHVRNIEGDQSLINYFRHCVYDAVAEWQAQQLRARLESNTIKMLKDQLLKISFQMEQHAYENEFEPNDDQ